MTYYLYHIPSKKIGVTRNLNKRVTQQQGYKPGEYEVLESSEDIDYISKKEIELQKSFGYKKDTKLYKNLFKMKINVTEQTTTFPVPLTKLRGRLHDQLGLTWKTEFGKILLCNKLADWISNNALISRYNSDRSYVYNKALWEDLIPVHKDWFGYGPHDWYSMMLSEYAKQNGIDFQQYLLKGQTIFEYSVFISFQIF